MIVYLDASVMLRLVLGQPSPLDGGQRPMIMATHDKALATAARAVGLEVVGV